MRPWLQVGLLIVAVLACCHMSNAGWTSTVYTASLEGGQESPTVGSKVHRGVAVCVLARHLSPKQIDCEVAHSVPLDTVQGVAIHYGLRGAINEDALYAFSSANAARDQFREKFHLEDIESLVPNPNPKPGEAAFTVQTYTVDEQVDDFLNGRWNINVLTSVFPKGEIRGQLEHRHRVYARLDSNGLANEDGSLSSATGLAVGTYSEVSPRKTISWELLHNVELPIGVEVTRGPATDVGHSVVVEWDNIFSPALETYEMTGSAVHDMFKDGHHLNILSTSSPVIGEIRSEVQTIDYLPKSEVSFAASLTGRDAVPLVSTAARGCALFTVDCESHLLQYVIVHTAQQPIGANLYVGDPGQVGRQLFSLTTAESPIYGSIVMQVSDFLLLTQERTYVDVSTALHPRGEIRGQITAQRDWVAYMSGTYMPEPVTTSAVGCATFQLIPERGEVVLNYEVTYSVKRPTTLKIVHGEEGVEGEKIYRQWGEPNTRIPPSLSGDDDTLDDSDLRDWTFEKMYVQVDSDDFPNGEIRGQIFRVSPCNAESEPVDVRPFLPPLVPPPPPPSPRDPFVIATVTIDNTTVEIVLAHIIGSGSILAPTVIVLGVAAIIALFVSFL